MTSLLYFNGSAVHVLSSLFLFTSLSHVFCCPESPRSLWALAATAVAVQWGGWRRCKGRPPQGGTSTTGERWKAMAPLKRRTPLKTDLWSFTTTTFYLLNSDITVLFMLRAYVTSHCSAEAVRFKCYCNLQTERLDSSQYWLVVVVFPWLVMCTRTKVNGTNNTPANTNWQVFTMFPEIHISLKIENSHIWVGITDCKCLFSQCNVRVAA